MADKESKSGKMFDVGEKIGESTCVPEKSNKNPEPYYPSLRLTSKQLPDIEGKIPGDKGIMRVEYEIKSFELNEKKGEKPISSYQIEIKKIGLSDEKVEKEKEETDELKETARMRLKAGRSY